MERFDDLMREDPCAAKGETAGATATSTTVIERQKPMVHGGDENVQSQMCGRNPDIYLFCIDEIQKKDTNQ